MQRARLDTPLKRLLVDEGRTQAWLAGRLDVDPRQVWGWVHGLHVPGAETQAAIAAALGRTVEELFGAHEAEVSSLRQPAHAPVGDDLEDAA